MTGNELRKYRRGVLDMTQLELADALRMSERTVSLYENRDEPVPVVFELAVQGVKPKR